MAVSLKQYEKMIAGLDELARASPRTYRMRVGALAVLGYVYIFLILAIALGILGVLIALAVTGHFDVITVKLGIVCLAFVFLILKSLRVSFPKPTGIPISRADCPSLFDLIDSVSAKLDSPKLHHVLVTDDFNASLMQRPILGVLGWQVNHLVLGLPLMYALTPDQFESVIAHEFGHLSGNHGRFGCWIYRVRQTWDNIFTQLKAKRGKYEFAFRPFFEWYAPYFAAYSFVQGRMDEYMADRCAADVTGPKTACDALLSISLKAKLLSEAHAQSLYRLAATQPEPPHGVMAMISTCLKAPSADSSSRNSLGQMLALPSGIEDTHPSLSDRLSALGYSDPQSYVPQPLSMSAAEAFLGGSLKRIEDSLDADWRAQSLAGWQKRYAASQQQRAKLAQIEAKQALEPLSVNDAWTRARCVLDLQGADAALPFIQETLALDDGHVQANLSLGDILLGHGDPQGEQYVLKAIHGDARVALAGSRQLHSFWTAQNRPDLAEQYKDQVYSAHDQLTAAREERARYKPGDPVLPHGMSPEQIAPLIAAISREPSVTEAFLVRKALQHFAGEEPMLVATVVAKEGFVALSSDGAAKRQALLRRIKAQPLRLPHRSWIRVIKARDPALKRIAKTIPDSLIYRKSK